MCRRQNGSQESRETMSEIAEKVKKIVVEHLGVEEVKVTNEASFIDDLGADSLDTVELVMAFEEAFSVEIPEDAAEKIEPVSPHTSIRRDQPGHAAVLASRTPSAPDSNLREALAVSSTSMPACTRRVVKPFTSLGMPANHCRRSTAWMP